MKVSCNITVLNNAIVADDAEYTKKGKSIIFKFIREEISFHKIQIEDKSNNITYIFKIAIMDMPAQFILPTVKHSFSIVYKPKKSNCRIKLVGVGTDLVFNKGAEDIRKCKLGDNEIYSCKCGERLYIYSSENELVNLGSGIKIDNVYAKGNLKSIDAVVNDEDPDAMLSFLGYYVAEMQKRQRWFEELEDATGRIIQKYENYRETNRSYGNLMPAMSRIIILIDEFQSLFDGSSCTAYMTELVRKGATYGIHVVLSSQRAVSDNPRNGFSSSLKDYFTSRFVFKTPQNAARSMLAERCADTGRENSGIQRSALLKKGQTVYNSYMGQSEADNSVVQCYYASPEVIAAFIEIISAMNGTGSSVLLKRHAKSVSCPRKRDGVLRIGVSITLHRDWDYDVDTIHDDTEVSLRAEMLKNMILSGADDRVLRSMLTSLFIWVDQWKRNGARLHIFGYDKEVYQVYGDKAEVFCHKTIQEQLEELARQIEDTSGEFCVNVFMEPDKYSEFAQSVGSIRSNPNVDLLKKVLDRTERHEGVTIAYCRSYKSMRSSMAYFPGYAPVRITAVGDMENLRCAMSDSTHLTGGEFDVPGRDAVKAYYYNKDTEKMGKVILYRPEIIL